MKWPWERSREQRQREVNETEKVRQRLKAAIDDLRKSLDLAERQMQAGAKNGR